jgi:uncharacterized protein YbcI
MSDKNVNDGVGPGSPISGKKVNNAGKTMIGMDAEIAEKIALVAMRFQKERTGFAPKSISVVRGGDTLVLTLYDALSPAEKELARTPEGALQVQEYHRRLFASSSAALRAEIEKIAGISVREAAGEIELKTGSIVQVFSAGTMVQVFLLDPEKSESLFGKGEAGDEEKPS